jgi:hypothetical protein
MSSAEFMELARTLHTTPSRLRDLLGHTLRQLPQQTYYVFRTAHAAYQPRTVAAFASPDDALVFAQRNGYGPGVQLRAVSVEELVVQMLSDATIGTVIFQRSPADGETAMSQAGLTVHRRTLLAALDSSAAPLTDEPVDLSAKAYDRLQFGVDFAQRAAFRVALTEAVEQIITDYRPPSGSLDEGPRSIFAASVVEQWLREHGFPHAYQRRWVSVGDDPSWGGAVEVCEVDAGSANRLLIQLVIHADDTGRQYIKWVNVTA